MNKITKILLVSVVLLVTGALLMGGGILIGDGFNRRKTHEVTHKAEGTFKEISVKTAFADIILKPSPDGSVYAICDEDETITYTLKIENEILVLKEKDSRSWYDYIGFFIGEQKVTLYLPEGAYEKLSAESGSGSVRVANQSFSFKEASLASASGELFFSGNTETLSVATSSGDVLIASSAIGDLLAATASGELELKNITIKGSAVIASSSGDISLENCTGDLLTCESASGEVELSRVELSGKLKIKTSSGEITLEACDAGEILLESASGEVEASLLSEKLFDVKTGSGRLICPASVKNGNPCKVTTSSGDITILILP